MKTAPGSWGQFCAPIDSRGSLMALEFETPTATRRFVTRCFERGLILNWTLHRDAVVRLARPLTITPDEIAHARAMIAPALHGT
jgi:acetylornithine/N-succinyldiaminopimelate aminotransferase